MTIPGLERSGILWLFVTVLGVGCGSSSAKPVAAKPVTHHVEIQGFVFEPRELTVAAGDTVVWTNHDFVRHTVTDDGGRWDSAGIDPDASWRSRWGARSPGRRTARRPRLRP